MKDKWMTREYLLFLALFLLFVPFLVTLNDVLTKLVEKFALYVYLQKWVVPIEVYYVKQIVSFAGIEAKASAEGLTVGKQWLEFNWNCLGWQSLLLYLATLVIGFRKTKYTFMTKSEVVVLGLLGVFWINILRISFIVVLAIKAKPAFYLLFHNVFAAFVTIVFLMGFWWFSYSFVLEERSTDLHS